MKKTMKLGFVSIETIITAALILSSGFFLLMRFGEQGSQLMELQLAKLENSGIIESEGGVAYDENGYPKELEIDTALINLEEDFLYE